LKDKITAFTLPYRYNSFTLRAYLCWRHNYCQWPIIELAKNVSSSPKNKMASSHVVQIHAHSHFRGVNMVDLSYSRTNRNRSNFATKHFQRKSLKIFDLHLPLRRLVFVAQIIT